MARSLRSHAFCAAARRAVALAPEDAFARTVLAIAQSQVAKDGQKDKLRESLETADAVVAISWLRALGVEYG